MNSQLSAILSWSDQQLIQFINTKAQVPVDVLQTYSRTLLILKAYLVMIAPREIRYLGKLNVAYFENSLGRPLPEVDQYNIDPISKAGASAVLIQLKSRTTDWTVNWIDNPDKDYLFLMLSDFLTGAGENAYIGNQITKGALTLPYIESDKETPMLLRPQSTIDSDYFYVVSLLYRFAIVNQRYVSLRSLSVNYPLTINAIEMTLQSFSFEQLGVLLKFSERTTAGAIYDYIILHKSDDYFFIFIRSHIDEISIAGITNLEELFDRITQNFDFLLPLIREHDDSELVKEYTKYVHQSKKFLNNLEAFRHDMTESFSPIYQARRASSLFMF